MQISLGRGTFVPLRLPHLATPLQTNKHKQSLTGKADITIDIYIYFTFSAVSVFFIYRQVQPGRHLYTGLQAIYSMLSTTGLSLVEIQIKCFLYFPLGPVFLFFA